VGHADLAGNVWEWSLDAYAEYSKVCKNCATLQPEAERVIRGGAFNHTAADQTSSSEANFERWIAGTISASVARAFCAVAD
jgi:formylglycine-generating enzyme